MWGMRPPGSPRSLEKRRLLSIRLLKAGHPYRAVARRTGASLSSVVRWHQLFRKRGAKGLRPRPSPGRPSLLSAREKKKLLRILNKGPLEAGYATNMWTLKRIRSVIRKEFGVRYTLANVWKLMHGLGWSCQKPDDRARERNEAAIQYWLEHMWPRIKKNRTTWGPLGLS